MVSRLGTLGSKEIIPAEAIRNRAEVGSHDSDDIVGRSYNELAR